MTARLLTLVKNKLLKPITGFLKQGATPKKLAITLVVGILIGIIPIPGISTIVCAGIALMFGLNMAAIQLVNYFVYPLQIVLFVPLIGFGQLITGSNLKIFSFSQISEILTNNFLGAFYELWLLFLNGVAAWILLLFPLAAILYISIKSMLVKYMFQQKNVRAS